MWTQHTLAHTVAIIPLGNEVVLSVSAIISNLSNLNFFSSSFCLLHGVLMKTFSWPEHCWLAESSIWKPSRKLTLLGPTPSPFLGAPVNCHLAIFSFFKCVLGASRKSPSCCGSGVARAVGLSFGNVLTLRLSGHRLLETRESKQELRA